MGSALQTLEEDNYYAFGMKHAGYNTSVTSSNIAQNINYQGQERQNELGLNWDSFKWRNYDYAIGRFLSIDPLAQDYVYNSPYAFAENRVVDGRELEGLEWRSSTSSDGKTVNLTLTARTVNNSRGIISNEQMAELANARATQLSKSLGGTDSQGRTVIVNVNFNDKATIEWSYTDGNDTSHKKYEDGDQTSYGDAMAWGLTDKIGNTQKNRNQVNVGGIYGDRKWKKYNNLFRRWDDLPGMEKEKFDAATQTGIHEDGHMLGGRHETDPNNSNGKKQGKDPNNLMNEGGSGTQITPETRAYFVNLIKSQEPK